MPIIKIFKGNIADQLYSEQNIIKTKSKDLQIKKQQMEICKRDMEKITLSESLVQVAKNQVYALTQISAFMDFVNSSDNQNSEITELYNTINPNYDFDFSIYDSNSSLLSNDNFNNNAPGRLIKVPSSSVNTYKKADGWSVYSSSIISQ